MSPAAVRADAHPLAALLFKLRVRLSNGVLSVSAWEGEQTCNVGSRPTHTTVHIRATWRPRNMVGGLGPAVELFPYGSTWVGIPSHSSLDGNYAKEAVLSCLAMRPGDADSDYFASYTPEQLSWAEANGEELECVRAWRYCDENGAVRK